MANTNNHGSLRVEKSVPILSARDIMTARQQGREVALHFGLSTTEAAFVATAISELARNIVQYARCGEIVLGVLEEKRMDDGHKQGIVVVARDEGPGISDVRKALGGGYSLGNGLGLGLAGVRQLMDEIEIDSQVGQGTIVTATKWRALASGEPPAGPARTP